MRLRNGLFDCFLYSPSPHYFSWLSFPSSSFQTLFRGIYGTRIGMPKKDDVQKPLSVVTVRDELQTELTASTDGMKQIQIQLAGGS